ncbi:MAG: rod shape-determining protein RodA [Synergistaceae bacterium]|jgi:rod shape determining protein RodA|nr:rod shape-determining protein RodA [Synergistaceae bacterium]
MVQETCYGWGEIRRGLDKAMLLIVLSLFALGLVSIYSAGVGVRTSTALNALKQLSWGLVSAVAYVAVLRIGYQNFVRFSYWIYGGTLVLLMVLLLTGTVSRGAASWFRFGSVSFQPAELGKVSLILVLSRFCSRYPPDTLKKLASTLLIAGLGVVLILLQPDLGSSLVYCAIIFVILTVAGTPGKYLGGLVMTGIIALPFFWSTLKTYQKLRLVVFLDPYIDPQGAGYNVIQSRIAVGSGGLWGKGFLHGTQGRLHFLPEPHTDFIFSVFSEEFGFVGGVVVVLLFALLFWRLLRAAFRTKDTRAKLLCVGVVAWTWFQVMESIAMSMGLAPITGLPLPLFSYGGSSLLMTAVGLALAQSVAISPVRDDLPAIWRRES